MTVTVCGVWNEGGEVTLTGLTPFTSYSIEVAAVNNQSDVGEFSEPVITQTDENSEAHDECVRFARLCHTVPSFNVLYTYLSFMSNKKGSAF